MDLPKDKKVKLFKWAKAFRKSYKNSTCLAPNCDKNFGVKCHSISKTRHLSKIAQQGYVQWTELQPERLYSGGTIPYSEGIGRVTLFRGLCSEHDSSIFKPIDDSEFNGSKEQIFLFAYRIYLFQLWYNSTDNIAALGNTPIEELEKQKPIHAIPQYVSNRKEELEFHLWSMGKWKDEFDRIYLEKDYDDFNSYLIEFSSTPTILTAYPFFRPFDLNGNYFHVPIHEHPERPFIFTSILTRENGGGFALFSWHKKTDKYSRIFMDSLHKKSDEEITDILIKLFFINDGNLVIDPKWWENLEEEKRAYLKVLLGVGKLNMESLVQKFINDNYKIVNWNVMSKNYI